MSWAAEAAAVLIKDLRSEWRTRVALSGTALFALGALTLIALGLRGAPLDRDAAKSLAAALLWIVLFFTGVTGLGRAFVQEEERGTALALRLSARATAVWCGKFAANALLLLALSAIAVPLLLSLLGVDTANVALLFCVVFLGDLGLAAVLTMTGSLVAQASARTGLLAALSFPVLVPLLLAGVHGAKAALGVGNPEALFSKGAGDLQVLVSYAVIAVTASLLLFDFVWND